MADYRGYEDDDESEWDRFNRLVVRHCKEVADERPVIQMTMRPGRD